MVTLLQAFDPDWFIRRPISRSVLLETEICPARNRSFDRKSARQSIQPMRLTLKTRIPGRASSAVHVRPAGTSTVLFAKLLQQKSTASTAKRGSEATDTAQSDLPISRLIIDFPMYFEFRDHWAKVPRPQLLILDDCER